MRPYVQPIWFGVSFVRYYMNHIAQWKWSTWDRQVRSVRYTSSYLVYGIVWSTWHDGNGVDKMANCVVYDTQVLTWCTLLCSSNHPPHHEGMRQHIMTAMACRVFNDTMSSPPCSESLVPRYDVVAHTMSWHKRFTTIRCSLPYDVDYHTMLTTIRCWLPYDVHCHTMLTTIRWDSLAYDVVAQDIHYRVAKTRRMPYVYRSFSAKEPYK